MPVRKLLDFLNANNIKFVSIHHSKAYTAMEIAHSAHIHGHELAKTVMIKVDGKMAMAVLPASRKVDLDLLKKGIGATTVEIATEHEFAKMFPDCEIGAMPPFGNLFGMEVYVETSLTDDEEIAFNAGFLTELIRMWYMDFQKLVDPKILKF
jgi:Ala-tRNA(Pro) deacylase